MNGNNLLVDTNIVIYLLSGDKTVADLLDKKRIYISFITEIELLTFQKLNATEKEVIKKFISDCIVIGMNDEIKANTISIIVDNKLKIPDAIIAATSLYLKTPIVTADEQFKKVSDLEIIYYSI
jgi:predicted nucleic acid-binding protein